MASRKITDSSDPTGPDRSVTGPGRVHATQALAVILLAAATLSATFAARELRRPRHLRVCADPNNLPFSNDRGEGLENAMARLVARDLGADLDYDWRAQRRGFVRDTLGARTCDVMMGAPTRFERVSTTAPYYRSTYVFVYRKDRGLDVRSFDDPALRRVRVGVQVIGDDYTNTPPAHALSRRGIVGNVVGYTVYGDYAQPDPPARIIDAVAKGDIDVAIAWGPLAGYFAPRQAVPLAVVPVSPPFDSPDLPFVFDISMAVRRGDDGLRRELDGVIQRRRGEIDALLREFGVPRAGVADAAPVPAGPDAEKQVLSVLAEMRAQGRTYLSVPPEDGRALRLLTEAVGAKTVVEIGTSTGYSGLWFCLALQRTGGRLITFEIDPGRAAAARKNFQQAGVAGLATVVEGDAHEKVAALRGPVDVVFIDADKEGYVDYLRKLLPLVRPGGLILAHNVGMVAEYVKEVTANPDLETIIYREGAGLAVTLKKR